MEGGEGACCFADEKRERIMKAYDSFPQADSSGKLLPRRIKDLFLCCLPTPPLHFQSLCIHHRLSPNGYVPFIYFSNQRYRRQWLELLVPDRPETRRFLGRRGVLPMDASHRMVATHSALPRKGADTIHIQIAMLSLHNTQELAECPRSGWFGAVPDILDSTP